MTDSILEKRFAAWGSGITLMWPGNLKCPPGRRLLWPDVPVSLLAPADAELVESLATVGLLHPVLCSKDLYIVHGRRRTAAVMRVAGGIRGFGVRITEKNLDEYSSEELNRLLAKDEKEIEDRNEN